MRLFLVQLASTLAMTGLIWFVQVVHYPLFAMVEPEHFPAYEAAHANRTTWVVAPLMLLELASALAFLHPSLRPAWISPESAWLGAALAGLIWASTGLIQVPLHNQLHAGYSTAVIGRLVATNWARTAAWTWRAGLVLLWAYRGFSPVLRSQG